MLNIREIQIKTSMRCHLTPVRMVIIKNKCWWKCGEEEPLCPVGRSVNQCRYLENSLENPQKKNKNKTTIGHRNSTLGIYLKKMKILIQKDMCILICCSILYNGWHMEAIYVSIDRWMAKENCIYMYIHNRIYILYIYTHNGILLSLIG